MSLAAIWRNNTMTCKRNLLRCCVRPLIREPLAADSLGNGNHALGIGESCFLPFAINLHAGFAMVVAKVEFRAIALQMVRADVVKRADDSALENGEVAFNCVGMGVATDVFTRAMVYNVMALEHRSDQTVLALAIGHQATRKPHTNTWKHIQQWRIN